MKTEESWTRRWYDGLEGAVKDGLFRSQTHPVFLKRVNIIKVNE